MTLSERLSEYIAACFTGLWVQSHEHDDALGEIAELCHQESWRMATWDVDRGLQIPGQQSDSDSEAGGNDPLAAIYLSMFDLDPSQSRPKDELWTGAEIGSVCIWKSWKIIVNIA